MFANQISSKIAFSIVFISTAIAICLPSSMAQPIKKPVTQIISSNAYSVQTLRKVVDRSQCLSGDEAKYFLTQDLITRAKFVSLFGKCFRNLNDRYPDRIFGRNDLSPKQAEDSRVLDSYITDLRKNLNKIAFEFKLDLISYDEDLFSESIHWLRRIATVSKKLSYLKTNPSYSVSMQSNVKKKEMESVLSLMKVVQCFPKDIDFDRYIPKNVDNYNLSRFEIAELITQCLDVVNESISMNPNNIPYSKQDLLIMQSLQDDFSSELAVLKGRCALSTFQSHFLGYVCV